MEAALRLADLASGRFRALWWRLRGARLGVKSSLGPRVRIDRPWTMTAGNRFVAESDVWLKVVADNATLTLGDSVFLGRGTEINVLQEVSIGHHVVVAPGCFLVDHNHGLRSDLRIDQQNCCPAPVRIGDDVWLGAHAIVLSGVTIGDQAVVAAGACVTRDVTPGLIVAGVPARQIGQRRPGGPAFPERALYEF